MKQSRSLPKAKAEQLCELGTQSFVLEQHMQALGSRMKESTERAKTLSTQLKQYDLLVEKLEQQLVKAKQQATSYRQQLAKHDHQHQLDTITFSETVAINNQLHNQMLKIMDEYYCKSITITPEDTSQARININFILPTPTRPAHIQLCAEEPTSLTHLLQKINNPVSNMTINTTTTTKPTSPVGNSNSNTHSNHSSPSDQTEDGIDWGQTLD